MGSTRAAAKFGQNAAPENEMEQENLYNTHVFQTCLRVVKEKLVLSPIVYYRIAIY